MLTAKELKKICASKDVYIWGAMIVGQGVCRSLERIHIPVTSFVDSSTSLQGQTALGYPIRNPDGILEPVRAGSAVIVISSGHFDHEIAERCQAMGLEQGSHYILSKTLNHIDPSVDVTGLCNLKCISCPRGNESVQPAKGLMSAQTYKKVLDKLLAEIPLLGSIQMYTWGEPLLNPELPEIIRITKDAQVLVALSSNLNNAKNLESVVKSQPDWFKVSCSGWGESYEMTHTGGIWKVFLENLHALAKYKNAYHPSMQVTVNYHLYKHNEGEDYRKMEDLCADLGFIFRPSPAYLYPVDSVKDYIEGKDLSPQAIKTLSLLSMNLDDGIAKAKKKAHLPCPEERCFPINWDCSVRTCGVYFRPFIATSFLETPLAEILKLKRQSELCADCKKEGLHQFTGIYLPEKHLEEQSDS